MEFFFKTLRQNCFVLRDMPQPVTTKLLKKIECLDYEAITFDVFKSGVFTCCVLQGKVHYPMNTMSGTFRNFSESGYSHLNAS